MAEVSFHDQVDFENECRTVVSRLRAAMIELYDSIGADPSSPQDVARRFKLNKTLTWNITRMLQAPDPFAAVLHVPGVSSFEKVLSATAGANGHGKTGERVRSAAQAFEKMVQAHVGDRATLELMVDSMAQDASDGLELSRRLAFRGNSGVFGVQARTRLLSCFLAPNCADPTRLDMAMVSGYQGFRRLRESVRWPLFSVRAWSDESEPLLTQQWDPIETESGDATGIGLMRSYGSGKSPTIKLSETEDGVDFILMPGPVGNVGAFDCYRGDVMRSAASRYRTDSDSTGEFGANITTPVEDLVFDMIVHRDLEFALSSDVFVFARIFSHGERTGTPDDASRLPIEPRVVELSGAPPAVATPRFPRYQELVTGVAQRLDWDLTQFRATRLELKYPPLGATVLQRFSLPDGK